MPALFLLGRLIFGGFFLYSGVNHFLATRMMAEFTASKGVPMPDLAVMLTGALLIAGGLSIILGLWPHMGIWCIVVFLAAVTPIMHNFWAASDPAARMNDMGHFVKNLALLGGALTMLAIPQPWPYSLEQRRRITV